MSDAPVTPRFTAAIDLLRRTGAQFTQIRYHDDQEPIVWFVVASYSDGRSEVDAAFDPERAILRLCERVIDGGVCVHCERPTVFHADHTDTLGAMMDRVTCAYQWDPELATFRRGCE